MESEVEDRLRKRIEALERALGKLMDYQNGPPLCTYEEGWNEAMGEACTLLGIKWEYMKA